MTGTLKPMIDRERPATTHPTVVVQTPVRPGSSSFPSGHAAGAAAGAYSLTRIWVTPLPARLLWLAAAAVMSSRVYLGVHYPLDVAVGAMIGLGCAAFVTGGRVYRPRVSTRSSEKTRV